MLHIGGEFVIEHNLDVIKLRYTFLNK